MSGARKLAALLALALATLVWWMGGRDPRQTVEARHVELEAELDSGNFSLHPAELLELMQNTGLRLQLLDLRDENEYNLFHIRDARHTFSGHLLDPRFVTSLRREAVVVLLSNGEGRSREAWKLLRAQRLSRVYILQGGIHGWLQLFAPQRLSPLATSCPFDECRRYRFEAALGDRYQESFPSIDSIKGQAFPRRVKVEPAQRRRAGSCG